MADQSSMSVLDRAYDLSAIPVWVLLDIDGKLVRRHTGYDEGKDAVDEQIVELLFLNRKGH
ncbi:hypothetical protein GCM10010967_00690 [Dyadobacter beijingensis]|uniref:Uncharacterized protein n=1 Tax=Dyadobacter beijingensis TaxID=365489 RepID=A0ABQ2HBX3_9BACT|nr:hypothetical protein GCM10010967_00690 [Dyadobacter beijingensis]